MMRKRLLTAALAAILLVSLSACGETVPEKDIELDMDAIAQALCASGYFSGEMAMMDPESVPELLLLNEDRVEASTEDLVDARYYGVTIGTSANQFILLKGANSKAADRLEEALRIYAEDQRTGFELYLPEQAALFENFILERQGRYLIFAIGEDREALSGLCRQLMSGEEENGN